jgi:hypothetical protein
VKTRLLLSQHQNLLLEEENVGFYNTKNVTVRNIEKQWLYFDFSIPDNATKCCWVHIPFDTHVKRVG